MTSTKSLESLQNVSALAYINRRLQPVIEADYLSLFPVSNSWSQEQLHYSAPSKKYQFWRCSDPVHLFLATGGLAIWHTEHCPMGPMTNVAQSACGFYFILLNFVLFFARELANQPLTD